jgi:hypothetical protein
MYDHELGGQRSLWKGGVSEVESVNLPSRRGPEELERGRHVLFVDSAVLTLEA